MDIDKILTFLAALGDQKVEYVLVGAIGLTVHRSGTSSKESLAQVDRRLKASSTTLDIRSYKKLPNQVLIKFFLSESLSGFKKKSPA